MYCIKIIKAGCGPVAFQIIQEVLRRQIVYMEVQFSLSSSFISDLRDIGSISLACLLFLLDLSGSPDDGIGAQLTLGGMEDQDTLS